MNLERLIFLGVTGAIVVVTFAFFIIQRWLHERASKRAQAKAIEERAHLPASLHPVIDPAICIGSLSCISACPEGDILGVINGAAELIEGANCIGHGRCAAECPVNAIKLVFGTAERGVDLPEVDGEFESSRPGVYIAGELGGMGLIKNAITQGLQAVTSISERMGTAKNQPGTTDVVIVGAGPAGLAAAVGARSQGLSFRIIDQGPTGGTIAQYPRQKIVMSETVKLPIYGNFGRSKLSKEQLLETWAKVTTKADITVESGFKVEGIGGDDGNFTVQTTKGTINARKVVLATGRRGTPRKLGVPGEDLTKVCTRLDDPDEYKGKDLLVVGGGDSALEAACALSASGARVALSYRNERFGKCRRENQDKIAALAEAGGVTLYMASQILEVDEKSVRLEHKGAEVRLPNDFVITCLGGELPAEFLKKVGISLKRHHGEGRGGGSTTTIRRRSKTLTEGKERASWLVPALTVLGIIIIAVLLWKGRNFYFLAKSARIRSPLRETMRPGGLWGHGVGIVATLFMLSNFFYAVRKRWRLLKGTSTIRSWLTVHMFVGFMSPIVIAFHAAFQWNNLLATVTFSSLMLVVGAGIIGRFIYGLVPRLGGVEASTAMLEARWARDRKSLTELLGDGSQSPGGKRLLEALQDMKSQARTLPGLLLRMPFAWLRRRALIFGVHGTVHGRQTYHLVYELATEMFKLKGQIAFNQKLQRLLAGWRVFHVSLSVLLVVVITAHIGVAFYLGYRWLWK
jgi:putative YpdA family bacillithiol system oxidoreductase